MDRLPFRAHGPGKQVRRGKFFDNIKDQAGMINRGIQTIFSEVAERYELVNHVLTIGLDRSWRKQAARLAAKAKGRLWLDVCSGTGEMAESLHRYCGGGSRIVVVDFSAAMLARVSAKIDCRYFLLAMAEAGLLPFGDQTFDLVTISFATRNINTSAAALFKHLREFQRVLRPGGCFINLETSQPRHPIIRKLFHAYIRVAIRPIGSFLSGSRAGYAYLSSTIRRFYGAAEFARLLGEAGFVNVTWKSLLLGAAAIHLAHTPGSPIRNANEAHMNSG
jgi:demethylmenaquinone methyltransferase/2-methoxy-6-polyprenyl-1,4-benzoquinol methylase